MLLMPLRYDNIRFRLPAIFLSADAFAAFISDYVI